MQENKLCAHCKGGFGLKHPLFVDDLFNVVCDIHPLIEGHILIIPKQHISCMAALDKTQFQRYKQLYKKVSNFLKETYGDTAIFEHGIIGQTVFHAHTHFLPFKGKISDIVPEKECIHEIQSLDEIKTEKYLFIEISKKYLIDTKIGFPRFFRDRFAEALGAKERGNWKQTENNEELKKSFKKEIEVLKLKWKEFFGEN